MEDFTRRLNTSKTYDNNTPNNFDYNFDSNTNNAISSSVHSVHSFYEPSQSVPCSVYHQSNPLNDTPLHYYDNFYVPTNSPQTSQVEFGGAFSGAFDGSSPNAQELFRTQRRMLLSIGILEPEHESPISPLGTLQDVPTRPVRIPVFDKLAYKSRFVLLRQPDTLQRRSYPKEKRYICPKPLIICARETVEDTRKDWPRILEGTVTVELAQYEQDTDNNNPQQFFYLPHLLESTDGKTKRIVDNMAQFELTVTGNSGLDKFFLVFNVVYKTEEGESEEFLLSSPFSVVANVSKVKNIGERVPTVKALQPKVGPYNSETEVWIKGSEFNSPVKVTFAENLAKVVSVEENLLTVMAPKFPGLQVDTPVLVSVSNVYARNSLTAPYTPVFTYVSDRLAHLRGMVSQNEQKNSNELWHGEVL